MSASGADPPEDARRPNGVRRRADPLGRQSLFSAPPGRQSMSGAAPPALPERAVPDIRPLAPRGRSGVRPGRRELFSGEIIGPRSVVVDCQHCGSRTPVGALALACHLVPSVWRPAARYSRYMRCPACGRFGWCRLDWSVFRVG